MADDEFPDEEVIKARLDQSLDRLETQGLIAFNHNTAESKVEIYWGEEWVLGVVAFLDDLIEQEALPFLEGEMRKLREILVHLWVEKLRSVDEDE